MQAIAQFGGFLKLQLRGGGLHLLGEEAFKFADTSLKDHGHFLNDLMIGLGSNEFLADAGTAADVVIETGTVFEEGFGSLTEGEDAFDEVEGTAELTGIDVGAVVAVFGVGDTSFAGDEDTGIVFGPGDAEIGIFFYRL